MRNRLPALIAFLLLALGAAAQSGPWMPANADFTHPRTLMRATEVDSVRQALQATPVYQEVYERIFLEADAFMPNAALMGYDNWRRYHAHQAKNCAFVYLLDRSKFFMAPLDTLTPALRDTFRNRAIRALEVMNTNVESIPDWDPYLWRSNELTDNVIAYDLLKGAGVPDSLLGTARTKLEQYATNLHTQVTASFLGFNFFSLKVNNHALRSAAALALAGVVLNTADGPSDDADANAWVHTGLFHIDNVLWRSGLRQSEPGVVGGYSEGPHYLRFGMKHAWTLIHALGNVLPDTTMGITYDGSTRSIRNPWFDENYVHLATWANCILMPDGRMPSIEDSFVDFGNPETCQLERPELVTLMRFSRMDIYQTNTLSQDLTHSSDDIRAEFISSRTLPAPSARRLVEVLPEAGDLVLRGSWDTAATYLHVTAKHGPMRENAKGHNQADECSFILHAHGEVMALDAGYLKYDRRDAVDEPENHNMILVDGGGPSGGGTASAGGADAYVDRGYLLTRLQHGQAHTTYGGAGITRLFWLVDGQYVLDADRLISTGASHTYTWQCHGMGLAGGDSLHGSYVWDAAALSATWKKNDVSMVAHAALSEGTLSFSDAPSVHEFSYDSASTHTVLLAATPALADCHVLSALCPYVSDTPEVATRVDLLGRHFLHVDRPGHDEVLTASPSLPAAGTALTGDLAMPGSLVTLFSVEDGGQWDAWHLMDGSVLVYAGDTLMQADVPVTIALQRADSANYVGYVGGPCTVTLSVEFEPGAVNGFTVDSWSHDPVSGTVTVVFHGADEFYIHKDVIAGQQASLSGVALQVWPSPSQGSFSVRVPDKGTLRVMDAGGRLVHTAQVNSGTVALAIPGMAAGAYLLHWQGAQGRAAWGRVLIHH